MAKWKEDPQGRDFIEEVTQIMELPIYTPKTKGKFRPWLKEAWNKVENTVIGVTNNKQDKQDTALQTADKTVVGGINELKASGALTNEMVEELKKTKWDNKSCPILKAENGYQKFESGLIAQWGNTGEIPRGGNLKVVFPIAFTEKCFAVNVTVTKSSSDIYPTKPVHINQVGQTSFVCRNAETAWPEFANWIAIGF